jgi:hypothetical protein
MVESFLAEGLLVLAVNGVVRGRGIQEQRRLQGPSFLAHFVTVEGRVEM